MAEWIRATSSVRECLRIEKLSSPEGMWVAGAASSVLDGSASGRDAMLFKLPTARADGRTVYGKRSDGLTMGALAHNFTLRP